MGASAAAKYQVRHRPVGTEQWSRPRDFEPRAELTVDGLVRNTEYEFEVRAVAACGAASVWVGTNYTVPDPPALPPPGVPTTKPGPDGIDLDWGDGEDGVRGDLTYEIQRAKILGAYASAGALVAAHPTGTAGDAYFVGSAVYGWDGSGWVDVDAIDNAAWTTVAKTKGTTWTDVVLDTDAYTYRIRSIDYNGNVSGWVVLGQSESATISTIEFADETNDAIAQAVADRIAGDAANAQAIIDEATERAQAITDAVADEAQARADAILGERNAWTAAVELEQTTRQSEDESLAVAMSLVSAGSGEQFDSRKIWYFDADLESWGGNGTPTIVDGWLRPANSSNPYITSPAGLGIAGGSYRFAKARIKRVGSPAWEGRLWWRRTGDSVNWADAQTAGRFADIPEPDFNPDGTATIDWDDVGWWPATIDQVRLDVSTAQTDTDYYLIDWVAIGRPTPGAGVALVQDETVARQAADSALALQTTTLAAQLRGDYTGTDVAGVTQGLVYSERQARVSAVGAVASDVSSLQARMPAGAGKLATEASVTSEASARVSGDNALSTRTEALEVRMPTGSGELATASALSAQSSRIDNVEGGLVAVADDLSVVEARMPTGSGELATSASVAAANIARADGDAANAAAILQVRSATEVPGFNFIANPSGENGTAGWSGISGVLSVYTTSAGTTMLRLARSSGIAYAVYDYAASSTSDYVFSADCAVAVGPGTIRLNLQFLDAGGANLGITGYATNAGAGFVRLSSTGTPPAGTAFIRVRISTTDASLVQFRNAKLESGAVPTAFTRDAQIQQNATATQSLTTDVDALTGKVNAAYSLVLDVNGYISGIRSENTGSTSTFDVLASTFRVTAPGSSPKVLLNLTSDKLSLNTDLYMGNGRIVSQSGGYMKVQGTGFGSSNQFVEWFGPVQSSFANCTETNAVYYLKTNGSAYFGGTLSAGVLKNAAQSTQISASASVETGPFGTNGNQKVVVGSLTYGNNGTLATDPGSGSITATIVVEKSRNGGAWSQVATTNITGTRTSTPESGQFLVVWLLGGSVTYTDNTTGSTGTYNYRTRVTAASGWPYNVGGIDGLGRQTTSIVSTESN